MTRNILIENTMLKILQDKLEVDSVYMNDHDLFELNSCITYLEDRKNK